ncbi:MAG: hypothetical protein HAW60_00440 [Bdellovibrionales bacterium]|nr:hypothetical protein [Bdellovibrionales bacterium]
MKKLMLGLLTITLISCGENGGFGGGNGGGRRGDYSTWFGDLNIKNTQFLKSYGLCGNSRNKIKQDLLAYGIFSILTGSLSSRNIINSGLGIAFNRGIIQNCGRIKKVLLSLHSYKQYPPEGSSMLLIEPIAITRWNYSYGNNRRANDFEKLDNYIQVGESKDFAYTPPLILRKDGDTGKTIAEVSSFLWYQRANTDDEPEKLSTNRRLRVKVWRSRENSEYNKDVKIEIKQGSTTIGTSTLRFDEGGYYGSNNHKANPTFKRKVASFVGNLKSQSLLLGLAGGFILLMLAALLMMPKKEN